MALFESYERRIDKINSVLNSYGIASIEEAEKITKDAGLNVYDQIKGIQPICFENACWAYIVGAAIAIKKYKPINKRMIPPMKWRRIIEYIPNIIKREYQDTIVLNNSAVIHPILRANSSIPERIKSEATRYLPEKPVADKVFCFSSIISIIN